MEIKLNSNIDSVARMQNIRSNVPREVQNGTEIPVFENSKALEKQLKDLPEVRTEKLERARSLVGHPQYPPSETMNGLANLLAVHFGQSAD